MLSRPDCLKRLVTSAIVKFCWSNYGLALIIKWGARDEPVLHTTLGIHFSQCPFCRYFKTGICCCFFSSFENRNRRKIFLCCYRDRFTALHHKDRVIRFAKGRSKELQFSIGKYDYILSDRACIFAHLKFLKRFILSISLLTWIFTKKRSSLAFTHSL